MARESLSEAFEPAGAGYEWTPDRLRRARERPNRRRALLLAAGLTGLSLSWIHWLGLVVAGALIGLVSRSVRGAVAGALGFGALVLAVHVLAGPAVGLVEFLALTPLSVVSVAAAVLAPLWGSLVRALL